MPSSTAYKVKTITNKHGYHLKVAIAFIVALSIDLIWISIERFCRIAWTQLIWLSKRNMLDAVDLPGNLSWTQLICLAILWLDAVDLPGFTINPNIYLLIKYLKALLLTTYIYK